MSAVDEAFNGALASLRERYITGLGPSIAELKKFSVLCDFNETSAEIITAVSQLAHKLAGSGETLGFPEISSKAIALERVLESNTGLGEAGGAARVLARVCEAAAGIANERGITEENGAPELPPAVAALSQSANPRLLTISDDPTLSMLIAEACSNQASVTTFASCAEALDYLNEGHAELVLLDLDSPGCPPDGVAALHKQARALKTPILAIASYRRSATILHALSEGEIECLFKPIDTALLQRKLFETLQRQHLLAVICDDDPVIREFLKPRFEARGFQVRLARDGDELLEIAGLVYPSIIVLDRVMPGMDGLDVLRMLKSKSATQRIPVVILTSKHQPQDVAEGLRSGAAAYLAKPFSPDQVLAKCLEILGLARHQRP